MSRLTPIRPGDHDEDFSFMDQLDSRYSATASSLESKLEANPDDAASLHQPREHLPHLGRHGPQLCEHR